MVLYKLFILSLQQVIEPAIKIITNSNVITDRCMIANMFNNFLINGGKDLACSIPNVEMSPLEYFKNSFL